MWKPGDPVVLRETWDGRIWAARPVTVVEDSPASQMFYVHPGMRWKSPAGPEGEQLRLPAGEWELTDRVSAKRRALSFAWPGIAHAVLANWSAQTGEFLGWYINLQTPLRRTAVGFDYTDHLLDIVVSPDRATWEWKDEDELQEAERLGIVTPAEARETREEGERALASLLERRPPFDRPWEGWEPHPSWDPPLLPEGWDLADE